MAEEDYLVKSAQVRGPAKHAHILLAMPLRGFGTRNLAFAQNVGSRLARRVWKRCPGPGGVGTARNARTLESEELA